MSCDWTLPEPNVSLYTDEMMNNAKEFSNTAMVVISRVVVKVLTFQQIWQQLLTEHTKQIFR